MGPFLYGWIPVDRKTGTIYYKKSFGVLKKNEILGIFPDGGVNETILEILKTVQSIYQQLEKHQ